MTNPVPKCIHSPARVSGTPPRPSDHLGKLHSFLLHHQRRKRSAASSTFRIRLGLYAHPDVPSGTLSEKNHHGSKIYEGMKSEYWIYVPAQYKADTPAAVMIFNDGGGYINR